MGVSSKSNNSLEDLLLYNNKKISSWIPADWPSALGLDSYIQLGRSYFASGTNFNSKFPLSSSYSVPAYNSIIATSINVPTYNGDILTGSNISLGYASSASLKSGSVISSNYSYIDANIQNSTIIGGQYIQARKSNTVYVPKLFIQNKPANTTDFVGISHIVINSGGLNYTTFSVMTLSTDIVATIPPQFKIEVGDNGEIVSIVVVHPGVYPSTPTVSNANFSPVNASANLTIHYIKYDSLNDDTYNSLYNVNGSLYWNGSLLVSPVSSPLPIGTTDSTLRYNGSTWVNSNFLKNSDNLVSTENRTTTGISFRVKSTSISIVGQVQFDYLNSGYANIISPTSILMATSTGILGKINLPTSSPTNYYLRGDGTWSLSSTIIASSGNWVTANNNITIDDPTNNSRESFGTLNQKDLLIETWRTNGNSLRMHIKNNGVIWFNSDTNADNVTDGSVSGVSGAGSRLMWIPQKNAFRVGKVNGTQWDYTNIGTSSIVLGENSIAMGNYSLSAGFNNNVNGIAHYSSIIGGAGNNINDSQNSTIINSINSTIDSDSKNTIIGGYFNIISGSNILVEYNLNSNLILTSNNTTINDSSVIFVANGQDNTIDSSIKSTLIGTNFSNISSSYNIFLGCENIFTFNNYDNNAGINSYTCNFNTSTKSTVISSNTIEINKDYGVVLGVSNITVDSPSTTYIGKMKLSDLVTDPASSISWTDSYGGYQTSAAQDYQDTLYRVGNKLYWNGNKMIDFIVGASSTNNQILTQTSFSSNIWELTNAILIDPTIGNKKISINGRLQYNVRTITGVATLDPEDLFVMITGTSGGYTLTLSSAADNGVILIIKKDASVPSSAITISPNIEGVSVTIVAAYAKLQLISYGGNWYKMN